jgi:hypothetical protein
MYAERGECSVAEGFAQTETKESKWSLEPEDLIPHTEVSERAQSGGLQGMQPEDLINLIPHTEVSELAQSGGLQGISDPLPDADDDL